MVEFLRSCSSTVFPFYCFFFFNDQWIRGFYLKIGKQLKLSLFFKKGEKSDPGYYHPISLTSVVCKVFEFIIREGIIKHMSGNNLFKNYQHDFLPKRLRMSQL